MTWSHYLVLSNLAAVRVLCRNMLARPVFRPHRFYAVMHRYCPLVLFYLPVPLYAFDAKVLFQKRLRTRVTFFIKKKLFQGFAPRNFSDAFFFTLISNILSVFFSKFGRNCHSRPFESQFWPILTVFVILCGVQSPWWSNHLTRAKHYLLASFWCITHFFCRKVCAQWLFVFGDFH